MGHYDNCREENCGICGQRIGYCEHTTKSKEKSKTFPKNANCRGSMRLGNGCGKCEKCIEEMKSYGIKNPESIEFIKVEKEDIYIQYNDEEEMMKISKNGKTIFYGNYCDFDRSPSSVCNLFNKLGLTVTMKNNLESIG